MEQLDYNLLFRWFVGMDMDEPIWAPTVFTKNRDRLLNQAIARSFFQRVVERAAGLMSDEHFTVDGTLIEAWASQKSFQRKDGGTDGDGSNFRGQERKNDTHAWKTDPDARLYRKSNGAESRLAYLGHLLIENRHGLIADAMATTADGTAEREAGLLMLHAQWKRAPNRRRTVGADKAYDVRDFIDVTRELGTTPHVTQNLARPGGSAIDGRTTRHPGYAMSQHARPPCSSASGWTAGQAHTLLLVPAGRESPHPPPFRVDASADLGLAGADWLRCGERDRARLAKRAEHGEVSQRCPGARSLPACSTAI